jgi:hypothetical protein
MGSFHHVKKDYLPLYLNEFSYRQKIPMPYRSGNDARQIAVPCSTR